MTQWIPHGQILVPDTAPYADSRMINFTGLNGGGHTGYHELRRRAGSWPTTSATPSGPAELLKTSRDSYALGYYAYSLFAVAGTWSILAVEAALKLKLNTARNSNFKNLVKRAEAAGLLPPEGWRTDGLMLAASCGIALCMANHNRSGHRQWPSLSSQLPMKRW